MLKEQIFKKMKSWNTFTIVISIILTIISIIGIFSILWLTGSQEVLQELQSMGIDTSVYEFSAFETVISVVTLAVYIAVIVMAIMNSGKMKRQEQINITPYILLLILEAYSIIDSVITMVMNPMGGVIFTIIGMIIGFLITAGPALRILTLNKKLGNIEEFNTNDEEE